MLQEKRLRAFFFCQGELSTGAHLHYITFCDTIYVMKLLMLKGLPGSGKSTYAKELVAQGWKRVNKDDLRSMIDGGKWSKENEKYIFQREMDLVTSFLYEGFNVVVDDTNFSREDHWKVFSQKVVGDYGVDCEFEVKFFDVPVQECIRRDALRGEKSVGAKVIQRMAKQNKLYPKNVKWDNFNLPFAIITDMDGTLALMGDRSPYDWSKVGIDEPNRDVAIMVGLLKEMDIKVLVVSGRDSQCGADTIAWLDVHHIPWDKVFMRAKGDTRADNIVKGEIYEQNIKGKYNILGVFDDRDSVVALWRELGLTCFQVNYGNF